MSRRQMADVSDGEWDLIVAGAGCAGLATALFAAMEGLSVLVLERSQWIGGTSALAAGAMWIPNTRLAGGSGDSPEAARRYLELASGHASEHQAQFLRLGPRAVECLSSGSEVELRAFTHHPDYLSELEGSTLWGRVLECTPFDGRRLGASLGLVRPPIPEFTILGGMMVDRIDIGHLLGATRSWASFRYATRLLMRYGLDRLRHPRGTRMVMGNALIGRLLLSLQQRGVPIWTETAAQQLLNEDGRVVGVRARRGDRQVVLRARRGVVLAGGGFNDHPQWRRELIPAEAGYTPRSGTSTGDLLAQAVSYGARLGKPGSSAAFWAPVSVRRRRDGSMAVFPHFVLDRAKPGTVVVNRSGRRFVNESTSYHLFGEAMLARDAGGVRPNAVAYLIADRRALVRYGLGMVRPGGRGLRPFLRDGYLRIAPTLVALANMLGMDADALQESVGRMNAFARTGSDEDFGRGSTAYQRNLGDAHILPNPTLGPIGQAPFYALELHPGDIGAISGLVTDVHARVLNGDTPIKGLFAVGNDMQSIMGGAYPGPGINLGPAVVFAYAAVQAVKEKGDPPA